MKEPTKFEVAVVMIALAIDKAYVRLGHRLGFFTKVMYSFKGGWKTVYKNKNGDVLLEEFEY